MQKSGINSSIAKKSNRGFALQMIAREENCTRSLIIQKSGLSRMAVTNIVNELIAEGYVVEAAEMDVREKRKLPGKKPGVLKISEASPRVLGVYLSRAKLVVALSRLDCSFEYMQEYSWEDEDESSIGRTIVSAVEMALRGNRHKISGIGVASIGPLDALNGIILNPPSFFGVNSIPIKAMLEAHTSLPVTIINDMDAGALAELMFGYGKTYSDFIYVGLTHGIGAGIVSDGHLYQKGVKNSGELGHMSIDYNGPVCACGNKGCLELYLSMPVVLKRLNERGAALQNGKRLEMKAADFEEAYTLLAYKAVFEEIGLQLAVGLANASNLLAPQAIVLGHEGILLPAGFRSELEAQLNKMLFIRKETPVRILTATFGASSALAGAVCCVLRELFSGNTLYDICEGE